MAYNIYDVGLRGDEIKRRLQLLNISDEQGVAKNIDLIELQKLTDEIQESIR